MVTECKLKIVFSMNFDFPTKGGGSCVEGMVQNNLEWPEEKDNSSNKILPIFASTKI